MGPRRLGFWLALQAGMLQSQTGIIATVAGRTPVNGAAVRGYDGDNGPATVAALALANLQNTCDPNRFEQTSHIAVDSKGVLYIADAENQRIRRVDPSGTIGTIAGTGEKPQTNSRCEPTSPPGDGGQASTARLFNAADVLVHPNGNLIIADQQNNRIRQVTPGGVITTIAGSGSHNFYAPGIPATASPMDWPSSLALDSNGTLYFSELHSNRIGRIGSDGRLATVAGTGFPGFNGDRIPANTATLSKPAGIAFDRGGNLLIADTGNHRVRRVASDGTISTIAGIGRQDFCGDGGPATQACLDTPMDVKADALGNIYVADSGNHRVRRIDSSGGISTVAGTGVPGRGAEGVAATSSALNLPSALALDASNDLYIVDWQNYLVRKVSFSAPPLVSSGGIVNGASFQAPVAPGGIFSLFGSNLAAEVKEAGSVPLPREIAGVSVRINGTTVPLYAVTPGQINAQLPYRTQPGTASAIVVTPGGASAPITFPVAPAAVGLFVYPGTDRAIAGNQDGSTNSPQSPEARGRAIVCYVTGLGAMVPAIGSGEAAPNDTLVSATATVKASVGGVEAQVFFAGLTAGFVGLGQVNIVTPAGAPAGDAVPVVIETGGIASKPAMVSLR